MNNVILDNGRLVGLITYWNFINFCYIEHFAIHPDYRNDGYGAKVLQQLFGLLHCPIVLEVEIPIGELEQRRIYFYERQGFVLWQQPYLQPPYRKGDEHLPMHLIAYGYLQFKPDFEYIKECIYREVYLVSQS